jgi:hypothetical protein
MLECAKMIGLESRIQEKFNGPSPIEYREMTAA